MCSLRIKMAWGTDKPLQIFNFVLAVNPADVICLPAVRKRELEPIMVRSSLLCGIYWFIPFGPSNWVMVGCSAAVGTPVGTAVLCSGRVDGAKNTKRGLPKVEHPRPIANLLAAPYRHWLQFSVSSSSFPSPLAPSGVLAMSTKLSCACWL